MFIHISLLIGAILSILVLIVSVVHLIMQNRLAKSALDNFHSYHDETVEKLNHSIIENLSTVYNQQKTIVELQHTCKKQEQQLIEQAGALVNNDYHMQQQDEETSSRISELEQQIVEKDCLIYDLEKQLHNLQNN